MAKAHAINGTRTRHGIAARRRRARPRVAGGSVRFWATSADVPTTAAITAKTRPARGCTMVAKIVTSAGRR